MHVTGWAAQHLAETTPEGAGGGADQGPPGRNRPKDTVKSKGWIGVAFFSTI